MRSVERPTVRQARHGAGIPAAGSTIARHPAAASRTVDAAPGRSVLGAAVRAVHRLGGVLARASAPVGPATSAVVQADREGVTCDVYEHAREQ